MKSLGYGGFKMNTLEIIQVIQTDFTKIYKFATPFLDSGALWDFCMDVIKNPVDLSCIVFANDLGTAPVQSLLILYQRKMNPSADFEFTDEQGKYMGCLMGFLFKHVLGYTNQEEGCKVGAFGVQTATRFTDGAVHTFSC